jgi:hypothetical protein
VGYDRRGNRTDYFKILKSRIGHKRTACKEIRCKIAEEDTLNNSEYKIVWV